MKLRNLVVLLALWYVLVYVAIRCVTTSHQRSVPHVSTPDASPQNPPEPQGDCGEWYDDDECET